MKPLGLDAVIIGGGIAGLWTLARLLHAGRSACLLESSALGSGQSIASQGIIHGGLKYALDGTLSRAARAIAEMPARWMAALDGATPDLSAARIAARSQLMWIPPGLGGGLLGLVAEQAGRGRAERLPAAEWPGIFRDSSFQGHLVRHGEPVLDVPTVLSALKALCEPFVRRIPDRRPPLAKTAHGRYEVVVGDRRLAPDWIICAAGAGNRALIETAGVATRIATQVRPLHMLLVLDAPGDLYAHCLGHGYSPKLTVTTHYDRKGRRIWYVGGQIAEDGVAWDTAMLSARGAQRLSDALPWLDFSACRWSGFQVDRAEPKTRFRQRPDTPVVHMIANLCFAWPSKLAFAPELAERVVALFEGPATTPPMEVAALLDDLAVPEVATPPWEDARWR